MNAYIPTLTALGSLILAGIAAWRGYRNSNVKETADLVNAESAARETLAVRLTNEVNRCHGECDQLRDELDEVRRESAKRQRAIELMELKLDMQERQIMQLRTELGSR